MFKKQVRAAAQCTARKSTENIFYVDDAAVSVEEDIGECSDSALSLTEPRANTCRGRTWLTWMLAYVLTV
ncbi:hypothetical protein PI125_g23682 [Phytophthora idaei]|nr:hypothetical protein PI125_g23682 [Phytophthora idaei]KAG3127798.1 hypothetical protein PI126_g21695 [Phytophthora idaei]